MSEISVAGTPDENEPQHTLGEYNGHKIRCRFVDGVPWLSATDMCKAAGKQWGHYYETQQAKSLIRVLREKLKHRNSDVLQSDQGRNGGTWVHKFVAYDLAMWCDAEFKLWVIIQVDAITQGKPVAHRERAELALDKAGLRALIRSELDTVTNVTCKAVQDEGEKTRRYVGQRMDEMQKRKDLSKIAKKWHAKTVTERFGCLCPACGMHRIVNPYGFVIPDVAEYDHFYARNRAKPCETWLICKECNQRSTPGRNDHMAAAFGVYQERREQVEEPTRDYAKVTYVPPEQMVMFAGDA